MKTIKLFIIFTSLVFKNSLCNEIYTAKSIIEICDKVGEKGENGANKKLMETFNEIECDNLKWAILLYIEEARPTNHTWISSAASKGRYENFKFLFNEMERIKSKKDNLEDLLKFNSLISRSIYKILVFPDLNSKAYDIGRIEIIKDLIKYLDLKQFIIDLKKGLDGKINSKSKPLYDKLIEIIQDKILIEYIKEKNYECFISFFNSIGNTLILSTSEQFKNFANNIINEIIKDQLKNYEEFTNYLKTTEISDPNIKAFINNLIYKMMYYAFCSQSKDNLIINFSNLNEEAKNRFLMNIDWLYNCLKIRKIDNFLYLYQQFQNIYNCSVFQKLDEKSIIVINNLLENISNEEAISQDIKNLKIEMAEETNRRSTNSHVESYPDLDLFTSSETSANQSEGNSLQEEFSPESVLDTINHILKSRDPKNIECLKKFVGIIEQNKQIEFLRLMNEEGCINVFENIESLKRRRED